MAADAPPNAYEIAEIMDGVGASNAARREQAHVILGLADYLAADLQGHPERADRAIASLAEWTDGDATLLARARTAALRDSTFERMHREALDLLRRASVMVP